MLWGIPFRHRRQWRPCLVDDAIRHGSSVLARFLVAIAEDLVTWRKQLERPSHQADEANPGEAPVSRDTPKSCFAWQISSQKRAATGRRFTMRSLEKERLAFAKTPEYKKIWAIIEVLQGEGDGWWTSLPRASTASGNISLRHPQALHAALMNEAEQEGVSLNQLCLAKLAVQLREAVSQSRDARS
jgi:hypothetical protein